MYIASLTNIVSDTDGAIVIRPGPKSEIYSATPRVSRTATLDGGAIINHFGFCDADRTIKITGKIAEADAGKLWTLVKAATFLNLATADGVFYGAISSIKNNGGAVEFQFLVKSTGE